MKNNVENEQHNKKNRQRGRNKRIGFSQEVVTKDLAKNLLSREIDGNGKSAAENFMTKLTDSVAQNTQPKTKKKKEKNKRKDEEIIGESLQHSDIESLKKKRKKHKTSIQEPVEQDHVNSEETRPKKRKKNEIVETQNKTQVNEDDTKDSSSTKQKSLELSKRAMKKIKHQQLVEDKKSKVDLALQQKALNYLSNWKHDRNSWKFEKLRQIWLLQNLYDPSKIEDKFWDTAVEYFNSSKGKVHKTILNEAIKIVESEGQLTDDDGKIKLKRARDIIQNLQE